MALCPNMGEWMVKFIFLFQEARFRNVSMALEERGKCAHFQVQSNFLSSFCFCEEAA